MKKPNFYFSYNWKEIDILPYILICFDKDILPERDNNISLSIGWLFFEISITI